MSEVLYVTALLRIADQLDRWAERRPLKTDDWSTRQVSSMQNLAGEIRRCIALSKPDLICQPHHPEADRP